MADKYELLYCVRCGVVLPYE